MIERILEGALFAVTIRTGIRLLSPPGESAPALARRLGRRRRPVAAIIITAALVAGCVLELAWPAALDALRQHPSGAWWQAFTAPFVQEGVTGALFNVISAAIVVAMAEWQWGRLTAAAIWLTGAWAPVGDLARLAGYHVSAANVTAYSAGSSGATYFTAATLCAALLWTAAGRTRLLGLVAPAIAAVMWIVTNDGHGVLFIEGFALGLLLGAGWHARHISAPADPAAAGHGTQSPDQRPMAASGGTGTIPHKISPRSAYMPTRGCDEVQGRRGYQVAGEFVLAGRRTWGHRGARSLVSHDDPDEADLDRRPVPAAASLTASMTSSASRPVMPAMN